MGEMSNLDSSLFSPLTNLTLNGSSPSSPQTSDKALPPQAFKSPPPLVSLLPPSDSASDSTSKPPSSSKEPHSPPPSISPRASPQDSSLSSPPPFSSVSPPPSPPLTGPPSLSSPPPLQVPDNSASPPPPVLPDKPASPPTIVPPTSGNSLPSPPPEASSSPAENLPVTPASDSGTLSLSPPSPPTMPLPEKPIDSPPPTSPKTTPSTSVSSPSTPITSVKPTPSTTPGTKSSNPASQLAPLSTNTGSSSSTHTSKIASDGFGSGAVVGVTFAGVVILLVAIFFVTLRKKRRVDSLINPYRPPASYSGTSDGYHRQTAQFGNSNRSDSYYVSKSALFPSESGNIGGSYRGYSSHSGPSETTGIGNSKSWFTYDEIADMTHGFSRENLLGEGGFGCVYKGWLTDGRVVAVKQLKSGSGQGEREFRAEVEIISRVHHRHLVSLVGYCIADNQRSLVYEFVPNNTLEHHLHGKGHAMEWPKRMKIAIGSARGLAYLHEDCHPRIIHRDIKSANILLDNSFEAQVADFGLAKLSNDTHTHVSTRVMGTFGYMAPEYASSGKLTDKSDVFSFGVVLLELVTGRKPVDPSQPLGDESLVEWARPRLIHALETGDFGELVDPRLENNYIKSELFRMVEAAAACVRHSAPKRPRMVQVLRALDNEGELSDLSNGVKYGQSTVFESRQYSADIQNFRKMAFGSGEYSSDFGRSGEYDYRSSMHSDEYNSREAPHKTLNPRRLGELGSGEYNSSCQRSAEGSHRFNGRGYY